MDEGLVERLRILDDARSLKILAMAHLHPEKVSFNRHFLLEGTDPAVFGRNYFTRYSAPETEEFEVAEERARVLAEAGALKKSAVDYSHPEVGVTSTDGACFGRDYFTRYSAPETEDDEFAVERAEIMEETAALKKLAADYFHPEVGVKAADATLFGRNYFSRYSAPETEDDEFADERAEIIEEMAALKKLAVDYLHPEVGVKAADATLFGRNYFNRYSAPETEDCEVAEESARVLAEAAALKKSAADYSHPEVGVKAADGACFGRSYFNRYSAPETEDDEFADERAEIMEEMAVLKKLAVDHFHPEIGVKAADGTCFGRNYFNRYSAPETEDMDALAERLRILDDARSLKILAVAYLHPEKVGFNRHFLLEGSDPAVFGRNYFNRYSAPETEEFEVAEERARVLAEAAALKKVAMEHMHPEVGVTSTEGACFGRNYFNRYSAPEVEDEEVADERAEILEDAAALKRLAAVVKGANLPSIKSAKLSSSDNNVGATKRSASTVNLFGLSEEVF